MNNILWHRLSPEQAAQEMNVDLSKGLSAEEVNKRFVQAGPNVIKSTQRRSYWQLLFAQFSDFMIMVLILAALISGFIGELQDTIAILVIIVLNAVIGFVQDLRAERALSALKKLAAPNATVKRSGNISSIFAEKLVPGDVVLLKDGDMVPADVRLTEVAKLQINEAVLTGESQPVEKIQSKLEEGDYALGDKINMLYKGTLVNRGRGEGIVVGTGMQTEIGHIASLLSEESISKTPLQKRLAKFGKRLAISILCICALIFITGLVRGESIILMFLTAVSLAVAAIPEALPAVVTVSLALGARKMVNLHALIRNLPAVETLGSVTYICADKTGTLTENSMRLEALAVDNTIIEKIPESDQELWDLIKTNLSLSNDITENADAKLLGDPTEIALYQAANRVGYRKAELIQRFPRVEELPFDAQRKRMTTVHKADGNYLILTKGAPESLLSICHNQLTSQGLMTPDLNLIKLDIDKLAQQGYRVLALAFRRINELPEAIEVSQIETELTFLGLVGLIDPPRIEVYDAIKNCKSAGIIPVMITGDHPTTALAIAKRIGLIDSDGLVMTGKQLAKLSETELSEKVRVTRVYARVTPAQKIQIVKALQQQDQFVAMTGDGVNDAPALKRANIGVAMGLKGTDVAREASHLVLLDDNFATIVAAVREGRRIFDNIRKFIKYTLTSNSGEIWTLFLAPFLGLPIPLLPIHILWINLVTDGLPGLALILEQEEKGIMQRPPRPPNESIFSHGMWQHMLWVGLLIGGVSLVSQAWAFSNGSTHWQTIVFTTLTFAQLAHVMAIRSERESIVTIGFMSNRALVGAILITFSLQLLIIYVPELQRIFKTQALSLFELLVCCGLALLVFVAVEIEKFLARKDLIYVDR